MKSSELFGIVIAVVFILVVVLIIVPMKKKETPLTTTLSQPPKVEFNLMELPCKIVMDPETQLLFKPKAEKYGIYTAKRVHQKNNPIINNTLVKGVGYSDIAKDDVVFDLNFIEAYEDNYEFQNDPEYMDKINCLKLPEVRLYYYKRVPYDLIVSPDGSDMFKRDEVDKTVYAYARRISAEPGYINSHVILTSSTLDPSTRKTTPVQIHLFLKDAKTEGGVIRLDFAIPPGGDFQSILQYNKLQLQYQGGKLFYDD